MSNNAAPYGRGAPLASISRRRFLAASASVSAAVGAGGAFTPVARADAGLVALVYTQASGDSGPIDAMMARLQQFADAQGLPTRAIHAQDPTNYENMLRALGQAKRARSRRFCHSTKPHRSQ